MTKLALIEKAVQEKPGLGFTALKRETGVATGTLQYHLGRSGAVEQVRGALIPKGYCNECWFSGKCRDRCLINVLRDERNHRILEALAAGKSHTEIARAFDLHKSTVSYHAKRFANLDAKQALKVFDEFSG